MPRGAEFIIRSLENAGYEAYIVGGCVRDALLGRAPEDWDITTNALPEQMKAIFPVTVDTGIQHGTLTVLVPPDEIENGIRSFEVTTFRIDGEYTDHRHPSSVSFTSSLEEDLARRDFTMNAMAYHMDRGIIDPYFGQRDMGSHIVRAVGKAEDRFREDALRMMRGIRFSAQLDFTLDEEAIRGIQKLRETLLDVSKERIAVELWKLLASGHPEKVALFFHYGLAPFITEDFPEIQKRGIPDLLPDAAKEKWLRFGLFLRGVPALSRKILRELKLDRDTMDKASRFARLFSEEEAENPYKLRKRVAECGIEMTFAFYEAKLALLLRKEKEAGRRKRECTEGESRKQEIEEYGKGEQDQSCIEERLRWLSAIQEKGDCVSLSDMAVCGKDLIALGIAPGKELGVLLHALFERVLEFPEENEKGKLLQYLKKEMRLGEEEDF